MVAFVAIAVFVTLVTVGAVVSRRRGARVHYIDAWTPADGEQVLLEDPAADFYVVPKLGRARVMSFGRGRRARAIVTDRALIVGLRAAFSKRHVITHVIAIAPAAASERELSEFMGGLFTTGYVVLSTRPTSITTQVDGSKPYLRIIPEPTTSATNILHLRLYCDDSKGMSAALGVPAAPLSE